MTLCKLLNQRVVKLENQLTAAQKALDANRPNVFKEALDEADQVLSPGMWDWILKTSKPYQEMEMIERIAYLLALHQGWELTGGWHETPHYWALKGCRSGYVKLNTDGLFYFFQCSRADFSALPTSVQETVWQEAVTRLTALLKKPEGCQFNKYRPEEARLHVDALSAFNLPLLLVPYLTPTQEQNKGSKEVLADWIKAEYARQYAKRGITPRKVS
jgi:hypothetical protein